MWMRLVVQLASAPVGYVGVELGGREIGVPEHLLHAAQIRAALEQMRGERVPEEVRVDPLRLEAGARGQAAQAQERARPRQRAAPRVQEELRPVTPVEERPPARGIAAQRRGCL